MQKKVSENLKILIINYEFPPLGGGGGVASYDLAVEWAKKGQVDVLTSSFEKIPKKETVKGINIYRSKIFFRKSRDAASFLSMFCFLITGFFKGISLIRKNRYHIINTHFAVPSGPLGYILGKIFKIYNVLSIHGGDIYDPSKKLSPHRNFFFKKVVKFILNRADIIVAQSSNTRDNALKYYKPVKDIKIIPLAFHPFKKPLVKKQSMGIKSGQFVLCSIGRIVKRKALDVVIKAIGELNNDIIIFNIIGDGPEKKNLEKLVNDLKLQKQVKFLGFVGEKEKYKNLSTADLFVLTSLHEGFGIVYLEAMFCGLPIICADHGGQVDFLTHKENALLIKVGDIKACAKAIKCFFKEKDLYNKCKKNNIKKIKDFYAESIGNRYLTLFYSLLEEG